MSPIPRLARLLPIALLLIGCAHNGPSLSPSHTTLATPRVEVPMFISPAGLPEVDATVNGQRVRCFVDTGSFAPMVAPSLAKRALLARQPTPIKTEDAGGNHHTRALYAVPTCSIGKATFSQFDAIDTDLTSLTPLLMHRPGASPPEMVLSPSLFADLLWTIDYATGRMAFERGSLPPPDGREILPLQISANGHLLLPGTVAGQEVWLMMDTGFSGSLAIPEWAASAFPGAGDTFLTGDIQFYYGKGAFNMARLSNDLTLGRYTIARPLFLARLGKEATIGADCLKHFTITFDQRNQRVRLHRNSNLPIQIASPALPLPMYLRRDTGTVSAVDERGIAYRAGVRAGDRVLTVDGIPFLSFAAGRHPLNPPRPGYISFVISTKSSPKPITLDIPYPTPQTH